MEHIDIVILTEKFNAGECTPEEIILLESWYLKWNPEVVDLQSGQINAAKEQVWALLPLHNDSSARNVLIKADLPRRTGSLFAKIAVAASLLFCLGVGFYLYQQPSVTGVFVSASNDVAPGGDKAVLTLANGEKIVLDNTAEGAVIEQAGIVITKSKEGELVYITDSEPAVGKLAYNTIETPRGGQYLVVLPDGSRVRINAESKLTYPTKFADTERRVELIGEAYFEVAANKSLPFRLKTGSQLVEVLGTHFNVNGYLDEPTIKTTLIEGSVRVLSDDQVNNVRILKPGEQSMLAGEELRVATVNTEEAIAWKNGDFVFENQTLPEIMRKVSRWYDVNVEYQRSADPLETFSGTVSRSRNLSTVLKMLEETSHIRFKIKGKNITVVN